jgi:hypothetical protein
MKMKLAVALALCLGLGFALTASAARNFSCYKTCVASGSSAAYCDVVCSD